MWWRVLGRSIHLGSTRPECADLHGRSPGAHAIASGNDSRSDRPAQATASLGVFEANTTMSAGNHGGRRCRIHGPPLHSGSFSFGWAWEAHEYWLAGLPLPSANIHGGRGHACRGIANPCALRDGLLRLRRVSSGANVLGEVNCACRVRRPWRAQVMLTGS